MEGILFDNHNVQIDKRSVIAGGSWQGKFQNSKKGKEKLKLCLTRVGWQEKEVLYNTHFEWVLDLNQVKSPRASVVVISWRFDPDTLKNFQALDAQRDQGFELIFVDNGASEDEFQDLTPYIDVYVKLNKNTGGCLARNIGAIFAKAPVIIFLDDDGIPGADYVKTHLEAFDVYDIIAARGVCNPKTDNPLNRFARHYYLGDKPFPRFCDLEGTSSFLVDTFFKAGGWDDEIFLGHEGVILSMRLAEVEPDMRKQIYLPGAVIDHDYAVDDDHFNEKREKQAQSRKHLLAKYPDLDDFLKSWSFFHGKSNEILKRKHTVSIIIVTYNRGHWISEAIQSALDQTSPVHEVLIIDDGSTDNTEEIVLSFADKRIRYIKIDENHGRPFARNTGIKEAEGEFILWLDDDDILIPETLERYIQILRRNPDCNLVYGKLQYFDDASGKEIRVFDPMNLSTRQGSFLQSLMDGCTIPNPGTLVKKTLYDNAGYYDEDFSRAQDYEFWTRAAEFTHPMKADFIVCRYRIHDRNISYGGFIDRTYESIIIRRLLERHPLNDLIPCLDKTGDREAGASTYRSIASTLFRYNDYYNAKKYIEQIEQDRLNDEDFKILLICDLYMGKIDQESDWLKAFLWENHRHKKAIISFGTNAKKYLDSIKAIETSLSCNDLERVKQALSEITEIYGITFDTMSLLGRLMMKAGNREKALQFSKKAFACNPENDKAFKIAIETADTEKEKNEIKGVRSRLLYKEKPFIPSIQERTPAECRDIISIKGRGEKTNDKKAMEMLRQGLELNIRGRTDQAVQTILKGIGLSPKNKNLYYNLADILINEMKFNAALGVLSKVPGDIYDILTMELTMYCKEELNQDDEAEEYAERILRIDERSGPALYLKGKLALKKGFMEEAENYFNRAIKSDEGFGPAYSCLGLLRKTQDREKEALDLLEKGFIKTPLNNEVLTSYHREIRAQMAFERGERIFRGALKEIPSHKLIHFQVIDLLLQQQKFVAAMDEIEKAMMEYETDEGFISAALNFRNRLGAQKIVKAPGRKNTVSLCMIVKNEEQNIGKCLLNLRPLVHEMIVVDTGSSDNTRALAEIFGAQVHDFQWNNDFSEARNYSISKATGDWILIMDADEIISPQDYDALRKIVRSKKSRYAAFSFVTRNYHRRTNIIGINPNDGTYGEEERGYGWVSSTKVRLFKNHMGIEFDYAVHEKVEPSLRRKNIKIKGCHVPIHHYGKLDSTKVAQKGDEYLSIGLKKLEDSPDDVMAIFELAVQAGELKKWEQAIELWKRYNRLRPDVPAVCINMATAYQKTGRFDLAIQSVKRAMELDPDMEEPPNNYGLYLILQGKADQAIPVLEGLVNKSPDYHPGRFKLAIAYVCEGKTEDAMNVFEELKRTPIGPGLVLSCRNIAKDLISFGQPEYTSKILEISEKILTGSFSAQAAVG